MSHEVTVGLDVELHTFFSSAVNSGEWAASCSGQSIAELI